MNDLFFVQLHYFAFLSSSYISIFLLNGLKSHIRSSAEAILSVASMNVSSDHIEGFIIYY